MRPTFALSSETVKVVNAFLEMTMNQRMTFEDLSSIVGFEVTSLTPAYHRARKMVERDHGYFIATARGEGFFRGNGCDMADSARGMVSHMRKTAKKTVNRADLAIQNNLPQEEYHKTCELRNRASIVFATTAAPMPRSNRPRRAPVPEAPKTPAYEWMASK